VKYFISPFFLFKNFLHLLKILIMRKFKYLFLILPSLCFSQNAEQIKQIKNSYNSNDIANLETQISDFNSSRNARVNQYLLLNNLSSPSFTVEGIKYTIRDIVDGKPLLISTDNRASAIAVRTTALHPGTGTGNLGLNLTGNGMSIGVWDGGWALKSHVEFLNGSVSRVTTPDGFDGDVQSDFHATHVSGTAGAKGVVSNARGMAYESSIKSYDWNSDNAEVISEATNEGLLISNHSYGIPVFNLNGQQNAPDWMMGCYNSEAQSWDQMMYDMPYYLQVTSAGNGGTDNYSNGLFPGLDKLTGEKNAKNNLVIANANPTVHPITGNITSLIINSSSSQGPTDDGRIKPDIAADGTNVNSTSNVSTTSYDTASGTSMASPSAAGSILLLQQHFSNLNNATFMKAATLKALVCHTALDDTNLVGPDPYFGWGLLDVRESAIVINKSIAPTPTALVKELTLPSGQTQIFTVSVSNPQKLVATISWTDRPGSAQNNALNSATRALKNDFDLRIKKGTEVNFPWKLQLSDLSAPAIKGDNNVDTVEKIEVDNASGTYTIEISHKGNFFLGIPQNYSLIVSGFDQNLSNTDFSPNFVSVYPNPSTGIFTITNSEELINELTIYDLQGRMIINKSVNNLESTVDLSPYNSGVYILEVVSQYGKSKHKLIKN
jgi:hypothetical protein